MRYTVKQIAKLAGVSPRALRFYDEIGLLKPAEVGENGYRYYAEADLFRLQQILFYKELGLPLDEIRRITTAPGFDLLSALQSHRAALEKRAERLFALMETVDATIAHLKGENSMSKKQMFAAFSDEEQEKMEEEAAAMYDPEIVRASNRKWKNYTAADKQRIAGEGNAVYQAFVDAMPQGPAAPAAQSAVAAWRKHLDYFWSPDDEQLLGLADLYNDDPRFRATFDAFDPRLADFVRQAVRAYIEARK